MNKARVSTQILLYFLMMLLLISGCTDSSDDFIVASSAPNTYSISGTVSGISGTTGVTINLTGASTASVKTDTTGAFNITGLASGKYTITPVNAGYIFTPSSAAVTVSGGTVTVPDFAATPGTPLYSISGVVTGDVKYQVLITLSGAGSATTWTDANGNYTLPNLVAGSYTVTPSLAGYTFSSPLTPTLGPSISNQNFTASTVPVSYEQTDLTGTWNMNILRKGTVRKEWERFRISVDSAGVASCIYHDSSTRVLLNQGGTLQSALTDSATSFYVNTGAIMPDGAVVVTIDAESIAGTYNSSTREITSCIRGYGGTTAAAHLQNTPVTYNNPTGETACPSPFTLTFTMVDGVVTPTGATALDLGISHMTMTSSKNLIAGTGTSTDSSYQMAVMQKEETGTVYTIADVQNKNFVYHQLQVGKINQWERAIGQTDAGGAIRLTSLTSPSGSASDMPKALGVTFVLNTATGRVDMSGTVYASFQGFLSDDKKTIVGTYTDNISDPAAVDIGQNDYHLIVFQMADQTYPAGSLPAGTSVAHLLGIGSPAYGWGYFTSTVDSSGTMTFGPPTTDNISIALPTSTSGSISASGVVKISGISSYHGQMSYDGKFIVGTRTLSDGVYSLQVDTK
ncbi:MAG: carboxypeptidase-like regulatory domain-containing protein [Smithella sp.]|nr:carboxypeptidase-like regulatory domain-containing protein [Smithella sp.]